jgi:hypothetical protein
LFEEISIKYIWKAAKKNTPNKLDNTFWLWVNCHPTKGNWRKPKLWLYV